MYIWQFIIFIVLWFPIEYLCIYTKVCAGIGIWGEEGISPQKND